MEVPTGMVGSGGRGKHPPAMLTGWVALEPDPQTHPHGETEAGAGVETLKALKNGCSLGPGSSPSGASVSPRVQRGGGSWQSGS